MSPAPPAPEPIVPEYGGANVRGIVPALLGPTTWATGLPSWMPDLVADARQVVLLVLDGLGWDQLQERRDIAPTIAGLAGGRITTVAPTTTSTALELDHHRPHTGRARPRRVSHRDRR